MNDFHPRDSRDEVDKFELQDEFKASDRETEINAEHESSRHFEKLK